MKRILYLMAILLLVVSVSSCKDKKAPQDNLSSSKGNEIVTGSTDDPYTDEEIEELGRELKKIEKSVNQIVNKINHQRQLYRRLGDRFFELGWLQEAYKQYGKSLEIKDDASVHYKSGVVAASYAKKIAPQKDLILNYETAEFHYLQAIKLRENYQEALVGIGFLYHFELKKPVEAWKYVNMGLEGSGRPTPQLLMLHGNIATFFYQYQQKNGAYPGAPIENWAELAYNDYNQVIEFYGKLKNPEVQAIVGAAVRMKAQFDTQLQ